MSKHMHDEGNTMPVVMFMLAAATIGALLFVVPNIIIHENHNFTFWETEKIAESLTKEPKIAIVPGASVTPEGPSPVLAERLDGAKHLYDLGIISRILLSGDNRVDDYNEPKAMYEYLLDKGVPADVMTQDPAGLSTYQTCKRAAKVYNISEAVIVSQSGHLDRAVFLCRNFDITAVGYATDSSIPPVDQLIREPTSNVKAIFNVWVVGEKTDVSERIPLQ